MNIPFLDLIQRGTKAVPATKYAVGILGMVAVVALVAQFKLDPRLAVFGTIILLGLMVLLVIFAKFSQTAPAEFRGPVKLLMWAFVLLFIVNCLLLSAHAFLGWPEIHAFSSGSPSQVVPVSADSSHAEKRDKKSKGNTEISVSGSPGAIVVNGDSNQVNTPTH